MRMCVGDPRRRAALAPEFVSLYVRLETRCDVGEKPLEGAALILRAIELTIAQVEARVEDPDRDESLEVLREMRQRWQAQADGG